MTTPGIAGTARADVAVLLSRFGNCPYLGEQLESLERQTVRPLIIDRSDDPPEHLGVDGSVTRLMSLVPADVSWSRCCDQDDVWFPGKTETMLGVMLQEERRCPGPILVHSDSTVTDRELVVRRKRFISRWARRGDYFGALFFNKVQGATMMLNRALFELVRGGPPEGILYDRYIHLMAESLGRRVFIDRPLMYYRQHESNAVGADTRAPGGLTFLGRRDWKLLEENRIFLALHGEALDAGRKRVVEEYLAFTSVRNPVERLRLAWKYLRPYPATLVKKTLKVALP